MILIDLELLSEEILGYMFLVYISGYNINL